MDSPIDLKKKDFPKKVYFDKNIEGTWQKIKNTYTGYA